LRELEVACRSNYANTKAKLNDYDTVLLQAIEVFYFFASNNNILKKFLFNKDTQNCRKWKSIL